MTRHARVNNMGISLQAILAILTSTLYQLVFFPSSSILAIGFVEAETPLKVGFIGGFSGPGKSYGEACKNGLLMGLGDDNNSHIEIIFEDDQFLPAKSVSAFKKLVEIDKVDLILSLGSGPGNALAPLAERKKIPLISWGSDPRIALNRTYTFRSWASGQAEGARLAKEAIRSSIDSIAIVSVTGDYNQSVVQGLSERFSPSALKLKEEFPPDTQDFKTFLLKAKSQKVQGVGVCLNPGQVGILGRQAKELGLTVPIFGCETFNSLDEYRASKGGLLDAWFVTGDVQPKFVDSYRSKFGNYDIVSGAAVHHDIARYILLPLATRTDRSSITEHILHSKVTDGAMGTYGIIKEANDQFFDIQLAVKKFTTEGIENKG